MAIVQDTPMIHKLPLLATILLVAASALAEEKMPPKVTYDEHVKPLFKQKCFSCHNPDKTEGDLDLTTYTNLMLGGGSGNVVEPGDSSNSYLYALITHDDEPYMPPKAPKIDDTMIETVRKWIDGGVLENSGSKAIVAKKKKFDFALKDAPTERPAVVPLPGRMSLEPTVHTSATTSIAALATSPWAPLAAIAGQKQVLLYNTKTLQLLGTFPFPEGVPQVLKFSRNGSLLLAGGGRGGASGRAIVWNVKTGERVFEIGDELDTVLAADISSDHQLIALGGPKRVVRIYSTESGQLLHELRKHTDWIYTLEFSPDSVLLATGDRNGGMFVWEGWTGREYLTLKGHTKAVTEVSWRSDSNILASCSEDASVRLWEMENGGQVKTWTAHPGGVASIEFARDGRLLTCGRDRTTKLWDQAGAQKLAFEAFSDLAQRVSFCDETNRAIAGDWTGAIRVWNAVDGKRLGQLSANPLALAARLGAAQQLHSAKQTTQKPLADAFTAAKAAADKFASDLATSKTTVANMNTQINEANAKIVALQQTLKTNTAAHQAVSNAASLLESVVPLLNEAAAKSAEAAAKIPGDQQLADAAAQSKVLATARTSLLASKRTEVTNQAKVLATNQTQLTSASEQLKAANAAQAAATAQVAKITPLVKPAADKAVAAKQTFDNVQGSIAIAQQQVDRWHAEIAFSLQLKQLAERRAAITTQLTAAETERQQSALTAEEANVALAKTRADIATSQATASASKKASDTLTKEIALAKQSLAQVTSEHGASAQQAQTMQAALVTLNEAVAKADEAAKQDATLLEAAKSLRTVATAKQTELAAKQANIADKAKAIKATKLRLTEVEKKSADTQTALAAATKRTAELTSLVATSEQKYNTAKQAVDAATAKVATIEKQLEALKSELAIAKGLVKAS